MATATDELTLLERVLLRIGSAETDEQLQSVVSKFLPPVLLKLSSQQDGVRKKVMELLVHVNKRIKSRPKVQLPVEALLLQYQDPSASSFVTNFTIIYIKMGYPRMPRSKQATLAPCLINALEGKPQSHQDSLLLLLMPILGEVPSESANFFRLNERPHLSKQLADFMLDMLLLPYGARPTKPGTRQQQQQQQQQNQAAAPAQQTPQAAARSQPSTAAANSVAANNAAASLVAAANTACMPAPPSVPPGMSEYGFKRVLGEGEMKAEDLEQIKLGIIKFLSTGVMADSEVICHLVVAAADTRFAVANAADSELKKIVSGLDWSSPVVTGPLFTVFLGSFTARERAALKPELKKAPASTRIRLKILPYLCRARGPALQFPACIQVVFDCLYGHNTNPRLKSMALQFTLLIIHWANATRLNPVAGVLLSGMLKLIAEEDSKLKMQAYSTVGKLGQRMPQLVNKDLSLLQTFFEALSQEDTEVRGAVREALLSFAGAFSELDQARRTMLAAMLARSVESSEPTVRFVAVRYVVLAFPATDAHSRFLLLLATADNKEEVATEAMRALYGHDKGESDEGRPQMPPFADMVEQVSQRAHNRMEGSNVGLNNLPFSPDIFTQMLTFTRLCLASEAGAKVAAHVARPQPLPAAPTLGRHLRKLLASEDLASPVLTYLRLLQLLLSAVQVVNPMCFLLEMVGCVPDILAPKMKDKLSWLKSYLCSTKRGLREVSAQLYGIIMAHTLDNESFDSGITELLSSLTGKQDIETKHGGLLTLGHGLERKIWLMRQKQQLDSLANWAVYKKAVCTVVSLLGSTQPILMGSACEVIAGVAKRGPLPLPSGATGDLDGGKCPGKLDVARKLLEITRNAKLPAKVKEEAAKAAGNLCVGETFPHRRDIMRSLLDSAKESRDVEAHLMVSEALVLCALGPSSPASRDSWATLESEYKPPAKKDTGDLEWLLKELLEKMVPDIHPASRQACCVWLLAVVKHCHHTKVVASQLPNIQRAFMDLLSDSNELVQDLASKGLGLVYEASGEDGRNGLVTQLLDQLAAGRKQVQQVTADTKIFDEGQLGTTPTGGNLSTYKELCSLASELNKPDLIYKFLHLANHNNVWNSKLGAAFGFSGIMSKAGEQLEPYLPQLVPKLFRYRFDPTPRIQNSMQSIWQAVVPDPVITVDQYQCEIMDELLTHLTSPQWRVRLSCCEAVRELLKSGRSLLPLEERIPPLWDKLMLVMDDVHEGTRVAAGHAISSLSKLISKACDNGNAKSLLGKVLVPILKGLGSTVAEVRSVCLTSVSELVRVAGDMLVPHVPLLLCSLLYSAGESESAGLNQLSLQLAGAGSTGQRQQEVLDSVRVQAIRSHTAMQTITKLLPLMDVDTVAKVAPELADLCGTQMHLGTRVGVAHFLVTVMHHLGPDLGPHIGKLIWAMVKGLEDRNAAVRSTFATTLGHLLHIAEPATAKKVLTKLNNLYFHRQDDATRTAIAQVLLTLGQNYSDGIKDHIRGLIVPLAFLGMHTAKSQDNNLRTLWTEVWTESVTWTEAGLRANLPAVTQILRQAMESGSWGLKVQAAEAIATAAAKLSPDLPADTRQELCTLLLSGLSGRTYTGKEAVLQATSNFTSSCSAALIEELESQEAGGQAGELLKAFTREARKEAPQYRCHSLVALGEVLLALKLDRFEEVYALVTPILRKGLDKKDSSEEEEEAEEVSSEQRLRLKEAAYETLGKAWPLASETQVKFREELVSECADHLPPSPRSLQVAIVASLRHFVERLLLLEPPDPPGQSLPEVDEEALRSILALLIRALSYALGVSKHPKLRKEALGVLFLLAKRLKEAGRKSQLTQLESSLKKLLDEASRDSQPEIKSRVADIRELFRAASAMPASSS